SILDDVKKLLGLDKNYTAFDPDIVIYVNSAIATLTQLGVGSEDGFTITGSDETWDQFIGETKYLEPVKTYVALRSRIMFDPPAYSFHLQALKEQVKELEWRLNVLVDREVPTPYPPPDTTI